MSTDGLVIACVECWYNNMIKDGMATAWSAGMYMTKDGIVTAWSFGIHDQRWNGLSL